MNLLFSHTNIAYQSFQFILTLDNTGFFIKILDFKTDVWNEEMMADLKANQVLLKKLGKIKTTPNLYDYVDNSFVKKAGSM